MCIVLIDFELCYYVSKTSEGVCRFLMRGFSYIKQIGHHSNYLNYLYIMRIYVN